MEQLIPQPKKTELNIFLLATPLTGAFRQRDVRIPAFHSTQIRGWTKPLRIDVYLSENIDLESPLGKVLDLEATISARSSSLASLPLTMHIMHALEQ